MKFILLVKVTFFVVIDINIIDVSKRRAIGPAGEPGDYYYLFNK